MVSPENVESLESYRPGPEKYEVSLTFSGDAGESVRELIAELNAASPNELVVRAIALLCSARGKEILLIDPRTGHSEAVEI